MSEPKKKIALLAVAVEFNFYSIVYKVRYASGVKPKYKTKTGPIYATDSIAKKDLNLKPTILSEKMEVVFMSIYMTPQFYQGLMDKTRKDYDELRPELEGVYKVGDVVGYVYL